MASALQHASNLLGQVTLNPIITAALLYLVTKSPDRLRGQLLEWMPTLKDPKRYGQIVKALTVCLVFGVTGVVNRRLNSVALNAWRWGNNEKKRWDWENEVAVVTGGCGGIGECT
jgi:all-trans-retinol dehydrogenase (NAD+)